MAHSSQEYMRDYMHGYRKEQQQKQKDLEEATRLLVSQVQIQALGTICTRLRRLEPPAKKYPQLKKEHLYPTFLETAVEAIMKEFPRLGDPEEIRAEVKETYEYTKKYPEETAARTRSSYRAILSFRDHCVNEKVEDAETWIETDYQGFPKKEQITNKCDRAGYFAECMRAIKPQGFGFYASREACGERFLDRADFWEKGWAAKQLVKPGGPGPESMARSRYDLGPEFFALNIPRVEFVKDWMEEERAELKKIEDLKVEIDQEIYTDVRVWDAFENLVKESINDSLSDGEIMERVKKQGADKILDPNYLKSKIPDLRLEAIKENEFHMDQQILRGIIHGDKDEKIMVDVGEAYQTHEHELSTRIKLLRKCLTHEISELTPTPELTKCLPKRLRPVVKIKL